MAISIKFTKFDNTPWGFRLAGGSDFPQPLTVIRVTEGSLAECMGLKVGDVVVRLNDQPISSLTHGQAHEELLHAGNNFVLGVQREEEARKAAEAISEENIVPYKIALADLPPLFPEQILKEETVIERYEEETVEQIASAEDEVRREEKKLVEEKPVDVDSEIVPNKNLTDDEIAQLILEEEELLSDQGLLGVNFKKLRPRASILKGSKVLEELQHIATAEPERVQELKRTSTFLQKPQRPVPKSKSQPEEDDGETYKVVIKKQDKKTVIARLVEKGLLPPGSEIPRTPESPYEVKMHETESNLEEDSSKIDPNPSCSTLSFDTNDDSLSSHFSEPDVSENRPLEVHPTLVASSICNSQFLQTAKPSSHRAPTNKFTKKVTRPSKCARAHYGERILLRNIDIFGQRLCSEIPRAKKTRVVASKRARMRGRYLATYLSCESARLISLLTALFQFLRKRDASEPSEASEVRKRRLSLKGRYLEHVLQKNVVPVLQCVKETCVVVGDHREVGSAQEDEPKSTKTKGRYMEKCLHRQNLRLRCALASLLDYAKRSLDNKLFAISRSLRAKRGVRARYFERLIRRNLEILDLLVGYVRSKVSEWLEDGPSCLSQKQFAVVTSSCIADDSVPGEFKMDPNVYGVKSSEWREEGPFVITGASNISVANEEESNNSEHNVPKCDVVLLEEDSHEDSSSPQAADKAVEEDHAFSRLLQSTENYISAEVFHRGSRRLSRPRKSIDIVAKEDNDFSKLLQSTEDYISTEVFHRGSRRLSRPRKSVDIVRKESDTFSKLLQSTEDYISTEVFHRGSRRLSRRLSKDAGLENGALSSLLRSTGDYVSNEVFHRRSRRLSRSSKKDISCTAPIWWDGLKNMCVNLPWFSLRITEKDAERAEIYVGKIDPEAERDGRRLSFVPTILYQGLTNHIGVDFTRLVAYAFVPCTSIILLYLYK